MPQMNKQMTLSLEHQNSLSKSFGGVWDFVSCKFQASFRPPPWPPALSLQLFGRLPPASCLLPRGHHQAIAKMNLPQSTSAGACCSTLGPRTKLSISLCLVLHPGSSGYTYHQCVHLRLNLGSRATLNIGQRLVQSPSRDRGTSIGVLQNQKKCTAPPC